MTNIWEWLKEWGPVVFFGLIILLIVGTLAYFLFIHEPLTEGYVIGKNYTPAHNTYAPIHMNVNGRCITVQNGDNTDWWYVSESYYDSVKIGDWVTK